MRHEHLPIATLLLDITTDIDKQTYSGHTYLHTAALYGHRGIAQLLSILVLEERLQWYAADALFKVAKGQHDGDGFSYFNAGAERDLVSKEVDNGVDDVATCAWVEAKTYGIPPSLE